MGWLRASKQAQAGRGAADHIDNIDRLLHAYVIYFTTGRTATEAKEKAAVASGMRQRWAINLCVPTLYKVEDGMIESHICAALLCQRMIKLRGAPSTTRDRGELSSEGAVLPR